MKSIRILSVVASGLGILFWAGAFEPQAAGQAKRDRVVTATRDLMNLGFSRAQIHGIIPDAGASVKASDSKPPEPPATPSNDTDGPSPASPHRTTG